MKSLIFDDSKKIFANCITLHKSLLSSNTNVMALQLKKHCIHNCQQEVGRDYQRAYPQRVDFDQVVKIETDLQVQGMNHHELED